MKGNNLWTEVYPTLLQQVQYFPSSSKRSDTALSASPCLETNAWISLEHLLLFSYYPVTHSGSDCIHAGKKNKKINSQLHYLSVFWLSEIRFSGSNMFTCILKVLFCVELTQQTTDLSPLMAPAGWQIIAMQRGIHRNPQYVQTHRFLEPGFHRQVT